MVITVGKDHFDPSLSTPIRKNGSLNREVFWKNSHGESKESNHVAGVKHLHVAFDLIKCLWRSMVLVVGPIG